VSTNLAKLRPTKGAPPAADFAPDVITENARPTDVPNTTIQFSIPPSVYEAFSAEAGRVHGHTKGSKTKLFVQMWEAYLKAKK
jgi:hypothetical protein